MQRIVIAVLAGLALASCAESPMGMGGAGPSPAEPTSSSAAAFDPRDFAWSLAPGTGSIAGEFSYRRGQARYRCEGGDVLLTPETAWSRRRMIILYGSAAAAAAPVSIVRARTPSAGAGDYARFVRRTTCDETNHFSFQGLPDGAWFVITVGRPPGGGDEPVAVTRRVETHGGVTSVVLS
jgi:hypothetical protein